MDFARRQRNPFKQALGVAFVVALHVFIVYALMSGLGRKVVEIVREPVEVRIIAAPPKQAVASSTPTPSPPAEVKPPPPKPKAPPPKPVIAPPETRVPMPTPLAIAPPANPAPPVPQDTPKTEPSAPPTPKAEPVAPAQPVVIGTVCSVQVKPVIPRRALQEGVSGSVTARATIRGGRVTNVEIVKSTPRGVFDAAVRTAMLQYQCDSSSQDVIALQEFDFKIE
ncbi:MAG TPA: TonB family protein [Burkholderiaceae bacterium]|nr:TonB family protein [Burkholderiaceae bacterium]